MISLSLIIINMSSGNGRKRIRSLLCSATLKRSTNRKKKMKLHKWNETGSEAVDKTEIEWF